MESNHEFKVGDLVRVKKEVEHPKHGFGRVTHQSIGTVVRIANNKVMQVEFPEYSSWTAYIPEMELVTSMINIDELVNSLDEYIDELERKLSHAD